MIVWAGDDEIAGLFEDVLSWDVDPGKHLVLPQAEEQCAAM